MTHYLVTWKIDLDADSPEDAARQALEVQRDPASIATFFTCKDVVRNLKTDVDLTLLPD